MRARGLPAALVLVALCAAGPSAGPQDPLALSAGPPVERSLSFGQSEIFRVALSPGEYVRVMVEQHGIDVLVEVRDPAGSVVARFDDNLTGQGTEDIDIASSAGGTYTVVVKPAPGAAAPGAFAIHLHDRHPATSADRDAQAARALLVRAAELGGSDRFDEARAELERALALVESARGPESLETMHVVYALGDNALERRNNAAAETYLDRAITTLDRTVGTGDPFDAVVRSRLALLYERTGRRLQAEAMARQAQDVFERTLGHQHLWYLRNLVTLANLRDDAGDVERARELVLQAMAITEAIHEDQSLTYAGLLNNLGNLYREAGDYALADVCLHRALEMGERLRGPDSFYVSTTLQNLGIVARERKDYETAKAYELRALAIRERLEGPDSPDVAALLVNLANVSRSMGDVATSIETQLRALHIWEATGGPYERGTLLSTGNLARAYAGIGDLPHAIEYQRRADALVELQLALDLSIGSERARLASARAMAERTDRTISLNLDLAPENADAAGLAALVLLQRKGRVLDAMADTFATVRRHADAADIAVLDELRAANAALSKAALTPRPDLAPAERLRAIHDLESRKERLEQDLGARSAEFRAQMMPVTVEAVRGAIPDEAALIEFAVYRPFNPKIEHNAEAYGPPHYAAYVIRRREAPVGFDLGPAAAIDTAIDRFREALRDPRCLDVKTTARDLDRLVMAPLRSALGDATRLLVAPDGPLNLVPFDALVGEDGRYLIQRYAVTYLTSGRDLLRLEVPRTSRSNPVIVGNPLVRRAPARSRRRRFGAVGGRRAGRDVLRAAAERGARGASDQGAVSRRRSRRRTRCHRGEAVAARRATAAAHRVARLLSGRRDGAAQSAAAIRPGAGGRQPAARRRRRRRADRTRGRRPQPVGHAAGHAVGVRHGRRRSAQRRGRLRAAARVRPRGHRDARHEPVAGERSRHARDDDRVLPRPARRPGPRRRAAAGEAQAARAPRLVASVLLGQLHPVGRVGAARQPAVERRRDRQRPTSSTRQPRTTAPASKATPPL